MLSKSFQSCTPSPSGYSPCLGVSADDHVECIHCLSLRLLAQAAAFGRRPKGSVKPTALSLFEGDEHEVRRGWRVNRTTFILLPKQMGMNDCSPHSYLLTKNLWIVVENCGKIIDKK